MAQEYTITQVSPQEPRTWQGPGGLIYYIVVKVAEHPKMLEVGKKAANSLKPGDKLYGNVTAGQYETDKFKPEQRPQQQNFPQQSSAPSGAFKPNYGQKTDDQQESIARSVALKAAVDHYQHADAKVRSPDAVLLTAELFLAWLTKTPNTPSQPEKTSVVQSQRDPVTTYQEIVDGEQFEGDPNDIPFN